VLGACVAGEMLAGAVVVILSAVCAPSPSPWVPLPHPPAKSELRCPRPLVVRSSDLYKFLSTYRVAPCVHRDRCDVLSCGGAHPTVWANVNGAEAPMQRRDPLVPAPQEGTYYLAYTSELVRCAPAGTRPAVARCPLGGGGAPSPPLPSDFPHLLPPRRSPVAHPVQCELEDSCEVGDECPCAHGPLEVVYHPDSFRRQLCPYTVPGAASGPCEWASATLLPCPYAHDAAELAAFSKAYEALGLGSLGLYASAVVATAPHTGSGGGGGVGGAGGGGGAGGWGVGVAAAAAAAAAAPMVVAPAAGAGWAGPSALAALATAPASAAAAPPRAAQAAQAMSSMSAMHAALGGASHLGSGSGVMPSDGDAVLFIGSVPDDDGMQGMLTAKFGAMCAQPSLARRARAARCRLRRPLPSTPATLLASR
jgi:hypothetical protein